MADKAEWALRRFCLECQGGDAPSVSACADVACLLFALRPYQPGAGDSAGQGTGSCLTTPPGVDAEARPRRPAPADAPARKLCPLPAANGPARAIRRFCLACAGSRREVRQCDAGKTCALWSFRFGVHPATFKRVLARLKKSRGRLSLPGL